MNSRYEEYSGKIAGKIVFLTESVPSDITASN
jgi:hypothetical protein